MSILRAGFALGEAIVAPFRPSPSTARSASPCASRTLPRVWLLRASIALPRASTLAAVLALAACASPHPAPIVHRAPPPPVAAQQPPPAEPAPVPPSAQGGTPGTAGEPVDAGVQTTPIARGPVETRPLPGAGAPPAGAAGATGAASANLLKTEPKALKQPYSDVALAQMRAAAPQTAATTPVPPVARAAPDAAAASAGAGAAAPAAGAAATGASSASEWIWPASGEVVQDFAQPRSMGIAIAGRPGDPIVAVNDGRVIFSGAGPRSYGNLVIVKHGDETLSVYAHNRALLVKEGQSVKRGQRIAELGSSGTDAPKLHFEIRRDGRPIDPRTVLPAR